MLRTGPSGTEPDIGVMAAATATAGQASKIAMLRIVVTRSRESIIELATNRTTQTAMGQ